MSDTDLALNPAEAGLVESARAFVREVVAKEAPIWEAERRPMPKAVIADWAARGLIGYEAAPERGGVGARFRARLAIAEALAEECFGAAFCLINVHTAALRIARDGTQAHRAAFFDDLKAGRKVGGIALTEPGAGSDFAAITTLARKVEGGWRLGGEKAWATNAAIFDQVLVYAQTDPAAGGRGIAGFLVDAHAPGFVKGAPYALAGGHVIGTAGFRLEECFVPEGDLLYPPGAGFKTALRSINGARVHVAAMALGMMRKSLAVAFDYGQRRRSFGKALIEHQGLRWSLADAATDIEAARLLIARAALLVEAGGDAALAAAHAKKFAVRAAERHIAACMQVMGAEGTRADHPLGRHLACVRLAASADGTTEIQNERIGALLGQALAR
ncbi:MAG: hypothetical protein FJX47_12205 [Alphaproteobacteria bacterium]|nr:hypothetical protein [Alphaproteobacteria bacterium]